MQPLTRKIKNFIKKYIILPLNNVPLRRRLLLSNLVINIVLVVIIAAWLMGSSYQQMLTQGSFTLKQSFDQSLSYINTKLESTITLSDAIIFSTYLNEIINREYTNPVDMNTDARSMRMLIRSFENNNGIDHARIYVNETWHVALDGKNICSLNQLKNQALLQKLFSKKGLKLFMGSDCLEDEATYADQILPMFRVMYSTENYDKIAFILRLDMDKQAFTDILTNTNPTSDSLSFILDENNTVIAASGTVSETVLSSDTLTDILQRPSGELQEITMNYNKYLLLRSNIALTDWQMITLVPNSAFFINFQETVRLIVTISLLIILVSLGLFSIISYTITRRLSVLCTYIKDAETGELVTVDSPEYRDEIGILYQNYNHMIERIRKLLKENYNMGKDLKTAEYKALQAQINPHFLYNTLDMISWFSLQGKSDEINEVVYSLARFYKISLSKGMDIISLSEELELTECYINIQKHRFANKITWQTDIDPEILQYSIPKITIQPLVENAIIHGILEKDEGGLITLKGRIEDGVIHIILSDNGQGMDSSSTILNGSSAMQDASKENRDTKGSHYGLRNIVLRLKLLYGSEYGLSIESAYKKGTVIHIHIPAITPDILLSKHA